MHEDLHLMKQKKESVNSGTVIWNDQIWGTKRKGSLKKQWKHMELWETIKKANVHIIKVLQEGERDII
jgi:hypothetical protein